MNAEVHARELENFRRLVSHLPEEEKGELEEIFLAFLETEEHLSPSTLQEALLRRGRHYPLEKIREALDLFCRLGFASRKEFLHQDPVYEHRHLGEHHDHLICTRCGRIQEFFLPELEALQEQVARRFGFKPLDHRLEIYGLCQECQRTRARPALPLVLVSSGERVRVERFLGGSQMKGRLAAMGIVPGEELEVINSCGPVIVSVKGTRLALGQGVAQKIMVSVLD